MVAIIQHVGTYSGPNPIFHLAVTESDIAYSWQGQSELNFVMRQMIPDHLGTEIDLSQGDTVILELGFTMGGWNTAHVEFVPFLQNNSSKEVLQATKVSHFFLPPPPVAPEANFEAEATISCQGYEVQYTDISTNNPTTWSWHFPGGDPEYSTEENPLVTYTDIGTYDVALTVSNIMGSDEEIKADYMEIESTPDQPSIIESNFTLESSAEEGNQWYRNDDMLAGATGQTYTPIHNGTYTVTVTQGSCTSPVSTGYEVMWVGINEAYNSESVKIYPTPNQGRFTLEINASTPDIISMKVYNTVNAVVFEQESIHINGAFKNQFDLGDLPNGIYFMVLEGEKENYLQKLVIQN
jgi:PKD repeat protein